MSRQFQLRHTGGLGLLALAGLAWCSLSAVARAAESQKVEANRVAEIAWVSEKGYANPFLEIELDAVVTRPDGSQVRVPAFWAGGHRWCLRYASGSVGTHTYRTECSDKGNAQLHGVEGKIEISAYAGGNSLYRHGPVRVAKDRRHFEQADGTPFFWLGDTWWKGLCDRITWEGFQELTADRKAKGFTVVQIIGGGPYPDEPPFDSRWKNEGGLPYEKDYACINPKYFDFADRRIEHLIGAGIVPAMVGGWGWHMPSVGVEKMNRHWRYLIARYGAYPVVWIVAGEIQEARWQEVAGYVRKTDPYHRLTTMHPPGIPELQSGRKAMNVELLPGDAGRFLTIGRLDLHEDTLLDFDLLQTSHNDWGTAPVTVSQVTASYSKTPPMPVVNGEVVYEWHKNAGRQDIQRFMFWSCMLNGAAGHTYGAGGIWQMNSKTVRGSGYESTPWFVAMRYPGSAQLGLGKKLLEEYPWWRFEPHPEWVDPRSTTLFEPHAEWYDNHKVWAEHKGRWDLPYAAGIPGEVRFVYIPGNNDYRLTAPTVLYLEPNVNYRAFLFDPLWGQRFDLGPVVKSGPSPRRSVNGEEPKPFEGHTKPLLFADTFDGADASAWKDYGTPSQRKADRLVGGKGLVTILEKTSETNLMASVEANSDAEAGIILRFHDPDNYLVALYSPESKSIYVHDRKNGSWGDQLGSVAVTEIGPRFRLTAAACGESAAMVLTDGTKTYWTPVVEVSNVAGGKAGVWLYRIGERQEFGVFELSRASFGPAPVEQTPAGVQKPADEYRAPQLPSPQDWVLVLERVK